MVIAKVLVPSTCCSWMNEYQVHVIVPTGTRSTCTSDMYIHKMKRNVNLERSTVCKSTSNRFVLLQGLAPTAP